MAITPMMAIAKTAPSTISTTLNTLLPCAGAAVVAPVAGATVPAGGAVAGKVAPQLVQNFTLGSIVAPHDVQNAMSVLLRAWSIPHRLQPPPREFLTPNRRFRMQPLCGSLASWQFSCFGPTLPFPTTSTWCPDFRELKAKS